jgi:hypothetical protein
MGSVEYLASERRSCVTVIEMNRNGHARSGGEFHRQLKKARAAISKSDWKEHDDGRTAPGLGGPYNGDALLRIVAD